MAIEASIVSSFINVVLQGLTHDPADRHGADQRGVFLDEVSSARAGGLDGVRNALFQRGRVECVDSSNRPMASEFTHSQESPSLLLQDLMICSSLNRLRFTVVSLSRMYRRNTRLVGPICRVYTSGTMMFLPRSMIDSSKNG